MNVRNGAWPDGTETGRKLATIVASGRAATLPLALQARVWHQLEKKTQRTLFWPVVLSSALAATAAFAVVLSRPALQRSTSAAIAFHDRVMDVHGAARVVLSDGGKATLVSDDARGIIFALDRGSLLASVTHRPQEAPFRIRTPSAEVKVVGTVLWVDVAEDGATTVSVARGTVEVTSRGGAPVLVNVKGGERWPADATKAPAPSDLERLGSWLEGATFARVGTRPSADGPDELSAESALFQLGWKALREQNDPRTALATWERQRTRFPSGALRQEADASIVETLVKLHDEKRAEHELDLFLKNYPSSTTAHEMRALRATLSKR